MDTSTAGSAAQTITSPPADVPHLNGKAPHGAAVHPAIAAIADRHLAELRGSGLSDPAIIASGITTETDQSYIGHELGWKYPVADLGPSMRIPYPDWLGVPTGYVRYKPANPRFDEEEGAVAGRPRKYEAPLGGGSRLYIPPLQTVKLALADPVVAVVLTEGEKKALCIAQYLAALGLSGVWNCWKKRSKDAKGRSKGRREFIDDLANIAWKGRTAYICFDSDAADKPHVLLAEKLLAKELAKRGAIVKIIRLPDGGLDASGAKIKQGADDYIVRHGAEAFQKLIDSAEAIDPNQKQGVDAINRKPWERIADPHYLVREYLTERRHDDRHTIAYHIEQFKEWTGTHWATKSDAEVRGHATSFIKRMIDRIFSTLPPSDNDKEPQAPQVTTGLVSNFLQALAGEVLLPQTIEMPAWIGPGSQRRNYIALENGILDVDALFKGDPNCLLPHTPNWFSPVRLDYKFDPRADCPTLRAFLKVNLEGEYSAKALMLQRFAGYLLLPDTSLQRFLLMLGEGANGKSVVCAFLRAMLGDANCASVPLEMFGCKFALETALGKLANIVAEVGELDKIAEGQLKAFTAGDLMQFERKFKTPFSARPTARLVLSSNNAPDFRDKSDGLWRRVLLLMFNVQIPPDQRIAGMDQPPFWFDERPGVLNWALHGLHQLRADGRFNEPVELQLDVNKLRSEANPARRFLTDHYRAGQGDIEKGIVYAGYKRWCEENGHRQLASNKFGSEVYRTFKSVKDGKVMDGMGNRVHGFLGLEALPPS